MGTRFARLCDGGISAFGRCTKSSTPISAGRGCLPSFGAKIFCRKCPVYVDGVNVFDDYPGEAMRII